MRNFRFNGLISIFFLLIFIWQLAGFFIYFEIERHHVRKDIKRTIELSLHRNNYKKFNFTTEEFNMLTWINDHEFKMNGRFYDVVKKNKSKIGFSVACIDDFHETVLFTELEEATILNLNNQPEKAPIKSFGKSFECYYLPMEIIQRDNQLEYQIKLIHNFHYASLFAQFKVSEQIPPPDFFV